MQIKSGIAEHFVDGLNFQFVKLNHPNNISDHIHQLGQLFKGSTKLPETAMMDHKQAYQQSNHQEATFRIVGTKTQKVVFQYQERNAYAGKQHCYYEQPITKPHIQQRMLNLQPPIKTLDNLAEWCAMPTGELQKHIAWQFKRFADIPDDIHRNHTVRALIDAKYIWNNPLVIPVTSFQYHRHILHMVCCTVSTWWRHNQPPSNNTVLLRMRTSPDKQYLATGGYSPVWLKCSFVCMDAELSTKQLVAWN
jgi:hypothetical protein